MGCSSTGFTLPPTVFIKHLWYQQRNKYQEPEMVSWCSRLSHVSHTHGVLSSSLSETILFPLFSFMFLFFCSSCSFTHNAIPSCSLLMFLRLWPFSWFLFSFTIKNYVLSKNQVTACQPHSLRRERWGLSLCGLMPWRVEWGWKEREIGWVLIGGWCGSECHGVYGSLHVQDLTISCYNFFLFALLTNFSTLQLWLFFRNGCSFKESLLCFCWWFFTTTWNPEKNNNVWRHPEKHQRNYQMVQRESRDCDNNQTRGHVICRVF